MTFRYFTYSIAFVMVVFFFNTSKAQVPNGSFEQWQTVNGLEVPLHWETNHTEEFKRLEKSNESVHGNFSLKLIPADGASGLNTRCESIAEIGFKLPKVAAEGDRILYYVKNEALTPGEVPFFTVKFEFYNGTRRMKLDYAPIDQNLADFTLIEKEIPKLNIDSVLIVFYGSGILREQGHGCGRKSNIWIDNISVDTKTSTEVAVDEQLLLYPNPASGYVKIASANAPIERYALYNMQGQLLDAKPFNGDGIELYASGMNILLLYKADGTVSSHKIMNQGK